LNCKHITVVCFLLFVIPSCFIALADEPPFDPTHYQIELDGGQKVFHMTPVGQENDIFLLSGLYTKSEPQTLIYAYEGKYLYNGELHISDDGRFIVNIPFWLIYDYEHDTIGGAAIEFYKDGEYVKSYGVPVLLNDMSQAYYTVSHITWDYNNQRSFDKMTNILTVQTRDNQIIKFDITTASIIDELLTSNDITDETTNSGAIGNPSTGMIKNSFNLIWIISLSVVVLISLFISTLFIKRSK